MRSIRQIAAVATVAVVAAGLGIAGATSASAQDLGPLLPGNVYLFNNHKNLATAQASDQVTGGTYAGAPFTSVAVDSACPAGTVQVEIRTRLKTAAAEAMWDEVQMTGGVDTAVDAKGHQYIDAPSSNFNLAQIQNFLAGTGATLPLAFICEDMLSNPLGYFQTNVRLDANTTTAGTWNQVSPTLITPTTTTPTATTTKLAATAVGANLQLTATVAPSAAAGTVTFADGATTIGSPVAVSNGTAGITVTAPSVGAHTYTATFTPTDATKFGGSTTSTAVTVAQAADGSITVTLTVPTAPAAAGGVTLSVPANATLALNGARDSGNTRITASATLPTITVNDTHRSDLLTAWQVNVQALDFTGSSGTVSAKYLGLTPSVPATTAISGPATVVQAGGAVASALDVANSTGLSTAQTLASVNTKGQGLTTLGGSLNLALPATTADGSYTSVVTVTLVNG